MSTSKLKLSSYAIVLLAVLTLETILGGSGRIFTWGPVSLRMVLFGAYCATFLLVILFVRTPVQKRTWVILLALVAFWSLYSLIGIGHGAPINAAFSDSNFVLSIVYLPLMLYAFERRPDAVEFFFRVFLVGCVLVAVATIVFFVLQSLRVIDLRALDTVLKELGYGGNTGLYGTKGYSPRVYSIMHLFLQFGVGICLARIVLSRRMKSVSRGTYLSLLTLLLALLITLTRGFWVGVVVSFLLISAFSGSRRYLRTALVGSVAVVGAIVLLVQIGYSTESLSHRVLASFDTRDGGNTVRAIQFVQAIDQVQESPLVGVGFGTPMPDGYYRMRSVLTGKPLSGDEFVIELSYVDLLRKTGFLGLFLFGLGLFVYGRKAYRLIRRGRIDKDKQMVDYVGYMSALGGFLLTATTNPYLLCSAGLFVFIAGAALTTHFEKRVTRL